MEDRTMRRLPIIGLFLLLGLCVGVLGLQAQEGQRKLTLDRPANQKWAVLIGVDQYTNVTKLKCCGKDALALKDRLVQAGFPADHVFVLHSTAKDESDRPFKANIEQQLELVLGRVNDKGETVKPGLAGKGDLVVVSFSGHGVSLSQTKASYLCPAETHLAKPQTLIPLEQVFRQLQACPAERKLLLVDACRNEPVESGARAATDDDRVQAFARGLQEMPKGKGLLVLTSCSTGECSYEEPEWGHGIFTYYLMEGLGGAADVRGRGYVTMLDLYQYASEKTTAYVARLKKEVQRPRLRTGSDEFDDFTIGVPTGATNTTPALLDCTGAKGVNAAEVKAAQQAWAKYLGRQVEEDDDIGGAKIKFVLVPPGKFLMGSPKDEKERFDEEMLHEVTITRPFYLAKTELTQDQYAALGKENKSVRKGADLPVENVSWEEAEAFARDLTQKKGGAKLSYRLPTEAEWEYACRGGRGSSSPFGIGDGTSLSSSQANFDGNYPYGGAAKGPYLQKTSTVGSYPANALGLNDMHGNVWEWCSDWYGEYPTGKVIDPTGPKEGSRRVYRSGSWSQYARLCRAAYRSRAEPGHWNGNLGFRLARVPSGK
jgi:formylglycine-generating enzyme required for sulfatase activity